MILPNIWKKFSDTDTEEDRTLNNKKSFRNYSKMRSIAYKYSEMPSISHTTLAQNLVNLANKIDELEHVLSSGTQLVEQVSDNRLGTFYIPELEKMLKYVADNVGIHNSHVLGVVNETNSMICHYCKLVDATIEKTLLNESIDYSANISAVGNLLSLEAGLELNKQTNDISSEFVKIKREQIRNEIPNIDENIIYVGKPLYKQPSLHNKRTVYNRPCFKTFYVTPQMSLHSTHGDYRLLKTKIDSTIEFKTFGSKESYAWTKHPAYNIPVIRFKHRKDAEAVATYLSQYSGIVTASDGKEIFPLCPDQNSVGCYSFLNCTQMYGFVEKLAQSAGVANHVYVIVSPHILSNFNYADYCPTLYIYPNQKMFEKEILEKNSRPYNENVEKNCSVFVCGYDSSKFNYMKDRLELESISNVQASYDATHEYNAKEDVDFEF